MPTIAVDMQKRFKLTFVEGLPEAPVEINGQVRWVKCCPLCSCTHQVIGYEENMAYTPLCQTLPDLYKTRQVIWRKFYPDVAYYGALHLVQEVSV